MYEWENVKEILFDGDGDEHRYNWMEMGNDGDG